MDEIYRDYLEHHGILGQKWGVRRFQNYDGSYTQRGLKRYNKALSDYESNKERKKTASQDYKSGKISKAEYKSSKADLRASKKELNKAYDDLKMDKLADEGKKLYKSGKTITSNTNNLYISEMAVMVGSKFVNDYLSKSTDQKTSQIASSAIAIGGTFVNGLLYAKVQSDNKKLRAYYAH